MAALPQLISRVCHPQPDVATLTRSIIAAAAHAHPQQALWALAVVLKSSVDARKAAAQDILSTMARKGDAFRSTANTFRALVEQLVRLCFHTPVNARARYETTVFVCSLCPCCSLFLFDACVQYTYITCILQVVFDA